MSVQVCSAPATREEDVIVTFRRGIRDAAEELHDGDEHKATKREREVKNSWG